MFLKASNVPPQDKIEEVRRQTVWDTLSILSCSLMGVRILQWSWDKWKGSSKSNKSILKSSSEGEGCQDPCDGNCREAKHYKELYGIRGKTIEIMDGTIAIQDRRIAWRDECMEQDQQTISELRSEQIQTSRHISPPPVQDLPPPVEERGPNGAE